VRFLVLHYTVGDRGSLKILTEQQVSAHYLVTDDAKPASTTWSTKPAAYHAGNSSWKNYTS
jgi:N-acetylmuramoyl-L-alanine amidase